MGSGGTGGKIGAGVRLGTLGNAGAVAIGRVGVGSGTTGTGTVDVTGPAGTAGAGVTGTVAGVAAPGVTDAVACAPPVVGRTVDAGTNDGAASFGGP